MAHVHRTATTVETFRFKESFGRTSRDCSIPIQETPLWYNPPKVVPVCVSGSGTPSGNTPTPMCLAANRGFVSRIAREFWSVTCGDLQGRCRSKHPVRPRRDTSGTPIESLTKALRRACRDLKRDAVKPLCLLLPESRLLVPVLPSKESSVLSLRSLSSSLCS